jgi:hypothetical protein
LQTQYEERRTRYGVVRCYRSFVIGRYRCHRRCSPSLSITERGDGPTDCCGMRLNLLIRLEAKTLIHSPRLFAARVAAPPTIR